METHDEEHFPVSSGLVASSSPNPSTPVAAAALSTSNDGNGASNAGSSLGSPIPIQDLLESYCEWQCSPLPLASSNGIPVQELLSYRNVSGFSESELSEFAEIAGCENSLLDASFIIFENAIPVHLDPQPGPETNVHTEALGSCEDDYENKDTINKSDKKAVTFVLRTEENLHNIPSKSNQCYAAVNEEMGEPEHHTCGKCGEVFPSKFRLVRHQKRAHQDELPTTCEICDKTFKTPLQLRLHQVGHHGTSDDDDLVEDVLEHITKTSARATQNNRKTSHTSEDKESKGENNEIGIEGVVGQKTGRNQTNVFDMVQDQLENLHINHGASSSLARDDMKENIPATSKVESLNAPGAVKAVRKRKVGFVGSNNGCPLSPNVLQKKSRSTVRRHAEELMDENGDHLLSFMSDQTSMIQDLFP